MATIKPEHIDKAAEQLPNILGSKGQSSGGGGEGDQPDATQTQQSLHAMSFYDELNAAAQRNAVPEEFTQRMRDIGNRHANNEISASRARAELRSLIRTEGPGHGIVHEWDSE